MEHSCNTKNNSAMMAVYFRGCVYGKFKTMRIYVIKLYTEVNE